MLTKNNQDLFKTIGEGLFRAWKIYLTSVDINSINKDRHPMHFKLHVDKKKKTFQHNTHPYVHSWGSKCILLRYIVKINQWV